jgi:serine/threonine protein kinase
MTSYSSVGTPDYIAPEVLRKVGYGPEADLWGVGCVLFEMLCGFPPFFSDDAHTTCRKIVQWRSYLKFPSDVHVEPQAQSLIRQLLCDGADRLTIAGCKVTGYLLQLLLQFAAAFSRLLSRAFHMFETPSAAIIYHSHV